jgi:hypothetical protein
MVHWCGGHNTNGPSLRVAAWGKCPIRPTGNFSGPGIACNRLDGTLSRLQPARWNIGPVAGRARLAFRAQVRGSLVRGRDTDASR